MAGVTNIEWTDVTWNPVAGCSLASAGCTNCYAMRMAGRLQAMALKKYIGTTRRSGGRAVWTGRINLDFNALEVPLGWRRGRRVFVNSMSDLFHEGVPTEFIERVWAVMRRCPQHQFQVLTKRPERMAGLFAAGTLQPLNHVWVGTSVEDSAATARIEHLLGVPNAVRFISFEPLIGSVGDLDLAGIHWAIVGGESGPGAREMKAHWVEEIRRSCRRAGAAFFFKQWGGPDKKASGRSLRGRTYDEYPRVAA
ncbi:MAG TPA: DUF5131 family protein [Allosphingosinicella sp.]|nr:DUF5131 family protein [Allosphingosinicella sp.]